MVILCALILAVVIVRYFLILKNTETSFNVPWMWPMQEYFKSKNSSSILHKNYKACLDLLLFFSPQGIGVIYQFSAKTEECETT